MKKKIVAAFAGTLVIAAFVFSGMSFKPGSLHELKAKGECECKSDGNPWCTDMNANHYWDAVFEC